MREYFAVHERIMHGWPHNLHHSFSLKNKAKPYATLTTDWTFPNHDYIKRSPPALDKLQSNYK